MSCWALILPSSARGASASISSSLTWMIRAAFSLSERSGSSFLTGRAFTARPPRAPTSSSRLSRSAARSSSRPGAPAHVRLVLLLEALDQRADSPPVRGRHLLVEDVQRSDRDVAVAPLSERVREPLHLRKRPPIGLGRKAGLEDLERGPQPARRHPHVVTRSMSPVSSTPWAFSVSSAARTETIRRGLGIGWSAEIGDWLGLRHGRVNTLPRPPSQTKKNQAASFSREPFSLPLSRVRMIPFASRPSRSGVAGPASGRTSPAGGPRRAAA